MPVLRKRTAVEGKGLYVHSSPPRVLSLSAAHVKHLIRNGDIDKLEQIVLEGQGKKLVGEYSADYKTRMFLKNVPALMSKIALLHDSVNSDRLSELQSILDEEPERKKKLVMAKDDSGVGLLHKAVYYDLKAIYRWILDKFPHTVSIRDSEGRTPYFYTLLCKDPGTAQKVLISAGADPSAVDYKQHSTKYYSNHLQELELPSGHKTTSPSRKSTASKESLNFKKSNIRIWIHQRNLTNLQQVVWEGHGSKLLVEHSNNTRVKKFLEAVPFIMSFIKDVHCDVQNGDLDSLKNRTSPPVPINVLTAKDSNGLTPLHKAVGLGKDDIVEYIIGEIPSSVNMLDNDGRTPLHYAALLKDNHKMFKFLVDNGADESILDHRQKSAAYYNNRASEMDTKLLHVVPECPRGAKEPHGFDWTMLKSISASLSNGIKKASEKLENGNNNAPTGDEENTEKNEKDDNGNIENNDEKQETEESSADKVEEPNEEQNNHEENTDNEATNAVDGSEQSVEGESEQKEPEESTEETKEDNQANDDNEETEEQQTDETPPQEENNPEESAELANTEETNQEDNDNDESIENVQDNEPNEEANDDDVQNNEETNEGNEEATETEERPSSKISEKSNRPSTRTENRSRPQTAREVPPEDDNDVNNDEEGEGNEDEEKNSPEIEGEGVIEGVVNGEHEVEPMNNEGQNSRDDDDDDIKSIIDSGNMEQLAALVLNGEGDRLVGQKSDNQELQTFLDNVPVYMSKIHRIHMAAREGSLRDLQAALDRRKFAVARDSVSPNGASPLHVAVVFSRTSVVRYLAGRFPETVHVEDDNGRTPLHYAAVLKDNGHYYNLLLHLGADNRVKDKFGHNAEYYLKNQTDFSHRQILADFGAEDEADDILNDRVSEDIYSSRRDMDDDDMIGVLERCYHVIHGRRTSSSISTKTNSAVSTTSSSTTVFTTLLAKHLKRYVYDSIRLRITKLDHNLYDVVWPSVKKLPPEPSVRSALDEDFPMGVVAPDYYAYRVFAELLEPMIKEYNYMDVRQPFGVFKASIDNTGDGVGDVDLDPTGKWVVTGSLECTRNLSFYELPKSLSPTELEDVERLITDLLLNSRTAHVLYPNASDDEIREKGSGTYYTMNEVLEEPSEARVTLASHGLLIPLWNVPDSDRLHGRHWPYGRGVFLSNSCNLAVYVNVLDHVRIVTSTESSSPGAVGLIYARLMRILSILDELNFRQDDRLGYLSARPSTLGCGLKFRLTLKCSNLLREPDNLRQLCAMRGLIFRRSGGAADVFRVSNRVSVGVNADQCFSDFTTAVSNILQLEKDMSMKDVPDTVDENNQVDMPFFATEEGRYLASSLGDPLIKGLTEVANKRPSDPIAYLATYLYNFARSRDGSNNSDDNPDQREDDITESQRTTAQADRSDVPANIDVVTVEPEDGDDGHSNDASRDEHGQSMLHFAAARSHGRNALYQLLLETDINVAYRDELYRTARDISIQANIPVNTAEIDKYILHIATEGDTSKLVKLLLDGYDHITDIVDEQETPIIEVVAREKQTETVSFLQSILAFEEKRERVHHAIRQGSNTDVMAMLADENDTGSGKLLAIGKNNYGRCSLHIAVLCQQEEIVDFLANTFTDTLRIGDNLERTALHYAMGVEKMETITRVLIKAGAKRVVKDLKGRQPTYYFLNKSDILRLQEEEETF